MVVLLLSLSLGVLLGSARVPWPAWLIAPALPPSWWAVQAIQRAEPALGGGDDNGGLIAAVAVVSAIAAMFGVVAGLLLRELTNSERGARG